MRMLKRFPLIIYLNAMIVLSLGPDAFSQTSDSCAEWFKSLGLKPNTPECIIECASRTVTTGTAECPDRCEDLCSSQSSKMNCAGKLEQLTKNLATERPPKWENASEKPRAWEKNERALITKALTRIPYPLVGKHSFKIYRMQKSIYPANPGSTLGEAIVLYDKAFSSNYSDRVVAHELAHLYYRHLSPAEKKVYLIAANWIEGKGGVLLAGRPENTYIDPDGINSPEEDFANNIELVLFEPVRLKKVNPSLSSWISGRFGSNFILGEGCEPK